MDQDKLQSLIERADGRIEALRATRLEDQLRQLRERLDGLRAVGETQVAAEVEAAVEEIERELGRIGPVPRLRPVPAPAAEPPPAPRPPPRPLDPADEEAVRELAAEIDAESRWLTSFEPELRDSTFELWALRFRVMAERVGQDVAGDHPLFKRVFAMLRGCQDRDPALPFLDALSRRRQDDWEARLREAQERYAVRSRAADALDVLRAAIDEAGDPDAIGRAIDECAPFTQQRDRVADLCADHRALLRERFEGKYEYLWKDTTTRRVERRAAAPKATRRDVLERLLGRMWAKKEIGGRMTARTNVARGFNGPDRLLADELIDLLIREEILLVKDAGRGEYLAIVPKWAAAGSRGCSAGPPSGAHGSTSGRWHPSNQ